MSMDDLNNNQNNNPTLPGDQSDSTSSLNIDQTSPQSNPPVQSSDIFNSENNPLNSSPSNSPASPLPDISNQLIPSENLPETKPSESISWDQANDEINQKFGDLPSANSQDIINSEPIEHSNNVPIESVPNIPVQNPNVDILPKLDSQPEDNLLNENSNNYTLPPEENLIKPSISEPIEQPIPDNSEPLRRQMEDNVSLPTSENPDLTNPVNLGFGNFTNSNENTVSNNDSNLPPNSTHERRSLPLSFIFRIFAGLFALIFFVVIIIFIASLFSNHKSSSKVTLTYWGLWEDPNIMAGVISDFERTHPNIIINYEKQDPNQYSARLLTRIENGNGPDIFRFHNSWIPMIQPVLAPLPSSVISPSDFSKNYYPVIVSDLNKNGAIYGIPLDIDILALFTNDKIFQSAGVKVPKTWNDFINAARLLTVKDENGKIQTAGAAFGTYDNITHSPDIMSVLFAQNGVNFNNFSKTSNNGIDALTFYTSFANNSTGVNTNINVWDESLPTSIKYFSAGKVAMYFGYSWDIFTIQALSPTLTFSVNPVPHLPGRDMTIASYWVEGVSNKSKNQKEADEFLAYLAQKDTMQKLYTAESKTRPFGELYPRVDMAGLLKNNNLIYPFIQQASSAVSSYFAGETFDSGINAQMNGYLANAINSVLGNTSSQTAMDTLTKGVSQVLSQYAKNNSSSK